VSSGPSEPPKDRTRGPAPPSIDVLARSIADVGLPHPLLVQAAREAVAAGDPDSARARAQALQGQLVGPVINATGVLLHTNLGRAPIAFSQPSRYVTLELDMVTGTRGTRAGAVNRMIAQAAGAEAAMVVNNGAAAVLLTLSALAQGSPVVISRGELVEIGGGFRIPEVLEASGARLVEVGTTNRTRLGDYRRALEAEVDPAVVLKVHQSNYQITGFTASVGVAELARLGVPVLYDIGSGLLDASVPWLPGAPPSWLGSEPAARQSLDDGADLVTFSADKLFGGPQAGIIAGRAELVARCARHPLARALRAGSLVLGALQQTALAYLRRDGDAIPFWRMATIGLEVLTIRANALGVGAVVSCESVPGGGSTPGLAIPSVGVCIEGDHTAALREAATPVIARANRGQTICDLRTVDPTDDATLADVLRSVL
jgi:L-seryl-tRNA(Ser) seleniumtransferase